MDYITGGSCGVPPYDWITEKIAPEFGYKIGDDKAPLIEYSAYFDPSRIWRTMGFYDRPRGSFLLVLLYLLFMAYQQAAVYQQSEHKLCDNSLGFGIGTDGKPATVQPFMVAMYLLS